VRVALTGEREGYYQNYAGQAAELAATIRQGWYFQGQTWASSGRPRGAPAEDIDFAAFVYCIQNHDQVGNRALGERLNHEVSPACFRAASALLLLVPQTPMLWMGQEWAASTPWQFFSDHKPELGRLITEGRRREFAHFAAFSGETVPDPQAEATFLASRLRWDEREQEPHRGVLALYRALLTLRREHPAMQDRARHALLVEAAGPCALLMRRSAPDGSALLVAINLGGEAARVRLPNTDYRLLLHSEEERFGGQGGVRLEGDELLFAGPGAAVVG
jgi:maltooligosyltrehalose trehalohydrolase